MVNTIPPELDPAACMRKTRYELQRVREQSCTSGWIVLILVTILTDPVKGAA